jgi:Arc/MetJ family transcription regulator
MKTVVDISPDLLEKAKRILGTRTIKGTVDKSLRVVVRQGPSRSWPTRPAPSTWTSP